MYQSAPGPGAQEHREPGSCVLETSPSPAGAGRPSLECPATLAARRQDVPGRQASRPRAHEGRRSGRGVRGVSRCGLGGEHLPGAGLRVRLTGDAQAVPHTCAGLPRGHRGLRSRVLEVRPESVPGSRTAAVQPRWPGTGTRVFIACFLRSGRPAPTRLMTVSLLTLSGSGRGCAL